LQLFVRNNRWRLGCCCNKTKSSRDKKPSFGSKHGKVGDETLDFVGVIKIRCRIAGRASPVDREDLSAIRDEDEIHPQRFPWTFEEEDQPDRRQAPRVNHQASEHRSDLRK
jgi:hypothetical protein